MSGRQSFKLTDLGTRSALFGNFHAATVVYLPPIHAIIQLTCVGSCQLDSLESETILLTRNNYQYLENTCIRLRILLVPVFISSFRIENQLLSVSPACDRA